jgi:aryl-alcohol dehydrogenase-like predicted oxidoreductase
LRRNAIDYYQLHTARINHLQNGECIEAMQQLQQEGKVRYWGLSLNTFDPFPEAEYLIQQKFGNGIQLVLNILNQKALPILKKANKNGYAIIARMPLQFGLLTGKFNVNSKFPVNDHRHNRLTNEVISSVTGVLKPVWELCDKYHFNKTQLALSYVLSYAEISTVIPGIRTPEHVNQNTTGLIGLDDKDLKLIETMGQTDFVSVMQLIQQQG